MSRRFGDWVCELGQLGQPHMLPVDDTYPHFELNCMCRPELVDGLMVHHSFDGREAFETGRRLPS